MVPGTTECFSEPIPCRKLVGVIIPDVERRLGARAWQIPDSNVAPLLVSGSCSMTWPMILPE